MKAREQALREKEDRLRQRADEEITARVRAAKDDIDKVVDELRREVERLTAEASRRALHGRPVSTGDTGTARAQAKAALDEVAGRLRDAHDQAPADAAAGGGGAARVGDRVLAEGPRRRGPCPRRADRAKRTSTCAASGCAPGWRSCRWWAGRPRPRPRRVSVNVMVSARDGAATEINVIGCSVEEALSRIERFLDDLLLSDERQVRIIHGFGTGQLRRCDRRVPGSASPGGLASARAPGARRRGRHGGGVEGLVALFPATFVDDLRARADIVQVIQEHVSLKKARQQLQGPVPVPRREDPVVPRQPREGVLPLLRLRRRRRRHQVRGDAGEAGVHRRRPPARPQVRPDGPGIRAGRERGGCAGPRDPPEDPRGRGGVVPAAAGDACRRARPPAAREPRRDGRDHRDAGHRLRAAVEGPPARPPAGAGVSAAAAPAERPRARAGQRPGGRPVPEPPHRPHRPRLGVDRGLRRAVDGGGPGPEVPELARKRRSTRRAGRCTA